MISLTQYGKDSLMTAMTDRMRVAHLMVDKGELKGHGYEPIKLVKTKWNNGDYPEITWEFEAGEVTEVLGYYVSDQNNELLFSELFDRLYKIEHRGDRISVTIKITLLGTGV